MDREHKDGTFSQVLKWVGYFTAIFSLCATVAGVARHLYSREEARKNVAALLASETEEQKAHDYGAAWQTLERALQLDQASPGVRAAQEELAMAWLEDAHLQEGQKFSDLTGRVEPILVRAVASTKPGPRQANLRAHIGWAYFLESRDGRSDLDPTGPYREAVEEDTNNPYAEAMWGHWILWQSCEQVEEAEVHFGAALASQREVDYVRRLEMSALLNCRSHRTNLDVIRLANDMRKGGQTPDDWTRQHILGVYYFEFMPTTAETTKFINAIPPAEHVATFRWLFDALNSDDNSTAPRAYYLGVLEEAAGQPGDALANYRLALHEISPDSTQLESVNRAIKRLTESR
jgi:hypothetical protein